MYHSAIVLFIFIYLGNSSILKFTKVHLQCGANIGSRVKVHALEYLNSVPHVEVVEWESTAKMPGDSETNKDTLYLSIGNTSTAFEVIAADEIKELPPESFVIVHGYRNDRYFMICNGLPADLHTHKNVSFDKTEIHYGAVLSTFACLEKLGFAFLHPLDPYIPSNLSLETTCNSTELNLSSDLSCLHRETESPYWPERTFHIHTQHPLEVTEVLQGHDIPQLGPLGPHCSFFTLRAPITNDIKIPYCERWEDMVGDVNRLFQWAVANRLNKIEWLLLGNYKWGEGGDELSTRLKRLRVLTGLGHAYGLMVGADCPIGNVQQHAWSMVNTRLPFQEQALQIR